MIDVIVTDFSTYDHKTRHVQIAAHAVAMVESAPNPEYIVIRLLDGRTMSSRHYTQIDFVRAVESEMAKGYVK